MDVDGVVEWIGQQPPTTLLRLGAAIERRWKVIHRERLEQREREWKEVKARFGTGEEKGG